MATPPHFNSVTIIGVGLLGGSLGLALKKRRMAGRVFGVGRRQSSIDTAKSIGAIDEGAIDISADAARADLIVIATPAAQACACLDVLRSHATPRSIITDVVSTKAEICAHAQVTWPAPRRFIGSHPMAGSEKWGPEHASAELYERAVTFVEDSAGLDPAAHATVCALWEALGSRVVGVSPEEHDRLLAATSHLPHIAASAIAQCAPVGGAVREAAGPGFRDTTRVAGGRPELWRDICLTNRAAVHSVLTQFQSRLSEVQRALETADGAALEDFFERGCAARKKAVDG